MVAFVQRSGGDAFFPDVWESPNYVVTSVQRLLTLFHLVLLIFARIGTSRFSPVTERSVVGFQISLMEMAPSHPMLQRYFVPLAVCRASPSTL